MQQLWAVKDATVAKGANDRQPKSSKRRFAEQGSGFVGKEEVREVV